jgi:hypothetical protein
MKRGEPNVKKGQHQILSTASLTRVLDILVERPTWADAMKHVGGSERLAFEWRAKCIKAMKAGDTSSIFWLEYRGEFGCWTEFAGRCRREHLIATEAKIRAQAADGIEEPIFGPTGAPVYKENPLYVGRSDQFIRDMEILAPDDDVAWYRLAHDENGHPIQLTRRVQIAAPIRRAVLAASHPDYRESLDVNVEHSGTVHVAKPLERLASEPRADVSELRRLAAMTPEQRRAELGGSKYPKNPKTGLVMAAQTGLGPSTDNRPDHIREQQPVALNAPNVPRPSYAKPQKSLDSGERVGRGEAPPGGFKIR